MLLVCLDSALSTSQAPPPELVIGVSHPPTTAVWAPGGEYKLAPPPGGPPVVRCSPFHPLRGPHVQVLSHSSYFLDVLSFFPEKS